MNFKAILLTIVAIVGFSNAAFAKSEESYNYTRALEEIEKGNNADAMEYLTKEIKENPSNGYAHFAISILEAEAENYSDAMTSINIALKRLPKKDSEYLSASYAVRAGLYAIAGDTIKAVDDYNQAACLTPDDDDILKELGQLLYESGRYDEADTVYRRIVAINPASVIGYMGLGRDACDTGNYEEAIRQYDTVIKMYDEYSSGYAFRAESYLKLGKYLEAVNDITKAISIDSDGKAYRLLYDFPVEQLKLIVTKIKGMAVKDPHDAKWWYIIGSLCKDKGKYEDAVEALQKAFDIDASSVFLDMIADCYRNTGDYVKALEFVNRALQMAPDDLDLISLRADLLGDSGDIDGAIAAWTDYIERTPDSSWGYYRRGFFEDNSDRTDAALEDYDMAIMLYPDYAYAYLGKGDMLMRLGRPEEAMDAYRKVVELDTVPNNESCAMYALLALGEKDKAVDFLNRVIENDSTDCGNYYDAACLYSRIGDVDKSLAYLRIALEKGFRRFHHVMVDDDLKDLRQTEGFDALMKEYGPTAGEGASSPTPEASMSEASMSSERVEIPFTPDGGCVSVKCTINELPLNFIFDTGASTVSLSQVEANFMLKNGYLKREDFVGSERYVDANGDVSEGSVVNLRNVDFGGLKLNNVRASVVRNQKAPLLLGQSVLGRLGSIEIDNPGKKLIIKHNK